MTPRLGAVAAIFPLLVLSGCEVLSPRPFFDPKLATQREDVLGTFSIDRGESSITIERAGQRYRAIGIDRAGRKRKVGVIAEFDLFQVGGIIVAQYQPIQEKGSPPALRDLMWRVARIDTQDGKLQRIRFLDVDVFEEQWKKFISGRPACGYSVRDEQRHRYLASDLYVLADQACMRAFFEQSGDAIWDRPET